MKKLTRKQISQCRIYYCSTLVWAAFELATIKNSIHPSNKKLEEAYNHLIAALKIIAQVAGGLSRKDLLE